MAVFGFLAIMGVVVFANFSGFNNASAKVGTVIIWGTLSQDAMSQELSALTTSNKAYSKVSYVQKSATNFDGDLANAIASGSGPDMIIISQEQLLSEASKITLIPFSSLPQRTYTDTYLPEYQLFLTNTGVYGIPFVLDPMVLYYNKTLLSQAGVATPPASWEAVTGLAPTLSKAAGQSLSQSTVPFGSYGNTENARGILSLLFLQAGSPISQSTSGGIRSTLGISSSANGTESTAGASGPTESALTFFTQFSDPARTVYSWNTGFPSARQAFLSGTLALYPGYASELPALKAANPNLSFDMAQIPQPQTTRVKTDYGLAYAFAIPKASRNQTGAYTVATTLSGKNLLGTVASALTMAPADRNLLVSSAADQYTPIYFPEALIAQGWLSPAPAVTDGIFSAMISAVTSGRIPARTALETADQLLNISFAPTQ